MKHKFSRHPENDRLTEAAKLLEWFFIKIIKAMASKEETIDFILDQIKNAGSISAKKMFGEYAIYCNNKVVALVCDDQLFIKPTISGKSFIGQVVEQPPYPGAKNYYLVSGDLCEDSEWLSELIKITQEELPQPKPKKSNSKKK